LRINESVSNLQTGHSSQRCAPYCNWKEARKMERSAQDGKKRARWKEARKMERSAQDGKKRARPINKRWASQ
jgi:hypothetical protein